MAAAPASALDTLMKKISKDTDSTNIEDSKFSKIEFFIDTGDFALNKIISGDFKNGIPSGKLTILAGESSSGKSFIAANCISNALQHSNVDRVFLFDSEGGSLVGLMESLGADLSKVQHILVNSVEDATLKMGKTMAALRAYKDTKEGKNARFFIVLDSIGNLMSDKVFDDIEKDKVATDMGQRAKQIKILTGTVMNETIRSGIPVLMINHVMDNPGTMHPGKVKSMGGGKSLVFNSHVMIQCSRTLEKDEKSDSALKSYYEASILTFFTTKNRIVRPFMQSSSFLHFQHGILRYYGLIDMALEHGLLVPGDKKGYLRCPTVHGDKNLRRGQIIHDKAIWDKIFDPLNEVTKTAATYGNGSADGEISIDDECDNLLGD